MHFGWYSYYTVQHLKISNYTHFMAPCFMSLHFQVLVGNPELFVMSNISLDNVWICTTHPDNEPLTVSQNVGTGGCLGGNLDDGFPKHIIQNGVTDSSVVDGNVEVYRPFINNAVRFSFPIEYTLERSNLYVHVQATIDITPEDTRRRRLLDIRDIASGISLGK